MPRPKSPAWTSQEIAVLDELYPVAGINGVTDALPERSWRAIYVMASRRGLRSSVVATAPTPRLVGGNLEEAIRLHERDGWGFGRIGARFGLSEGATCNAVMIALCRRKGYTPAQRDPAGRLTAEGTERLRLMLRKGLKGVEIQLRLGVSASTISLFRRTYQADLKARGKAPLPAPGNGEQYSGRKLTVADRREVEALFLQGLGAKKITERTSVSATQIGRIRNRLIKRLARKSKSLPGCDLKGKRHAVVEHARHLLPEQIEQLRGLLMEGTPVSRAAKIVGIGSCSAYRQRDALKAELAARGEVLPVAKNWRSVAGSSDARQARWLPAGQIFRYRDLSREIGAEAAKAQILAEMAAAKRAAAAQPLTFEQQLERVRNGASISTHQPIRRALPDVTFGGVATGMI